MCFNLKIQKKFLYLFLITLVLTFPFASIGSCEKETSQKLEFIGKTHRASTYDSIEIPIFGKLGVKTTTEINLKHFAIIRAKSSRADNVLARRRREKIEEERVAEVARVEALGKK